MILDLIGDRDYRRCVRCGVIGAHNRHHRLLRSQGGRDLGSNLISLCGSGTTGCHGWVHANPEQAQRGGWVVRSDMDPHHVPLLCFMRGWVLLRDDLSYEVVAIPEDADARKPYLPEEEEGTWRYDEIGNPYRIERSTVE